MKRLGTLAVLWSVSGVWLAVGTAGCERAQAMPTGAHAVEESPVAAWREANVYAYHVTLSSSARVTATSSPVAFELVGKLTLRSRPTTSGRSFLAFVDEVSVKVGQGSGVPPDLAASLAGPWGFDVVNGRLASLRVRAGTQGLATGIITTVAAAFQYPGARGSAPAWHSEEADASGHYRATYEQGSEPGTFTKKKTSYDATSVSPLSSIGAPLSFTPKIVASSGALRIHAADLVRYEAHEELEVTFTAQSGVHSKTDLSLNLEHRMPDAAPLDWSAIWSQTITAPIGAPVPSVEPARAFDTMRAAHLDFPTALSALEREARERAALKQAARAGAKDTEAAQRDLGAFGNMVSVLRAHPENLPLAISAVHRGSAASKLLLDALGSAGSVDAQAALAGEMRNSRASVEVRREAAFALIRTAQPAPASVDALIDALGDAVLRDYAVYGLGTYARRLRDAGEAGPSKKAADRLVAELARTSNGTERVQLLRGIANSGDARAFVAVRPLLDDPDVSVRAAAIDAMRLMPNPEVDELVASRVRDESPGIRASALDAAALRAPSDVLASAVAGAAIHAGDSKARLKAVSIVVKWLKTRPELRKVLEEVALADANDTVKSTAKAGLGT